jgi:hypothetical protein
VRGLIGETWRLLRAHGPAMLLVGVVFVVPAELAVAHVQEDSESFGIVAIVAVALIGFPWVCGALVATIVQRARSPLEPYGRTVDRIPALTAWSLIVTIPLAVGFVLLIVPGLLLAARWSATIPLIVLERQGPLQALETSNGLVRGRTWQVAGATAVTLLAGLTLAGPGLAIGELSESPWISGLGYVLFDLSLFLLGTALTYAVYRQAREV